MSITDGGPTSGGLVINVSFSGDFIKEQDLKPMGDQMYRILVGISGTDRGKLLVIPDDSGSWRGARTKKTGDGYQGRLRFSLRQLHLQGILVDKRRPVAADVKVLKNGSIQVKIPDSIMDRYMTEVEGGG
jgi:hypothetical protein